MELVWELFEETQKQAQESESVQEVEVRFISVGIGESDVINNKYPNR